MASSTVCSPPAIPIGRASSRTGEPGPLARARSRPPRTRGAGLLLGALAVFAPALPGLAGCRLLGLDLELTVALPAPPAQWIATFPPLEARIRFPGRSGAEELQCPWNSPEAVVDAARGSVIPVAARPAAPHGALPPCGALFPDDLDESGALRLRWERGFAADLLLRLLEGGVDISCFNARRFCREIEERFADPWQLDEAHIVQRILEGSFRVTDLEELPGREVVVPAGPGSWFTESPFSELWEADPGGNVAIRLTWGCHRLFRLGGGWSWHVAVSEDDIVMLECAPRRVSRSGAEADPAENPAAASPRCGSP